MLAANSFTRCHAVGLGAALDFGADIGDIDRPRVYVDGQELSSADIDLTLNPGDISAVEVYTGGAQMPPEFNRPAPGRCGVIVIWTK